MAAKVVSCIQRDIHIGTLYKVIATQVGRRSCEYPPVSCRYLSTLKKLKIRGGPGVRGSSKLTGAGSACASVLL